jgi:hypothetical protein
MYSVYPDTKKNMSLRSRKITLTKLLGGGQPERFPKTMKMAGDNSLNGHQNESVDK